MLISTKHFDLQIHLLRGWTWKPWIVIGGRGRRSIFELGCVAVEYFPAGWDPTKRSE